MNFLERAIATDGKPTVIGLVLLLALGVTRILPTPVRRRMRWPLLFWVIYLVMVVINHAFTLSDAVHADLHVIDTLLAVLAVARFVFLLVVDLGVERAGKAPLNQLQKDVLLSGTMMVAGAAALRACGIAPGSLIATGTVLTAIIGLALQETLGNLAAGVAIEIDKPITIGDWIQIDKGDAVGRVVTTNWRAVTIQTDDRALFVIPNGVFSKTSFYNRSRPGGATRRSLYFQIPYDVPPNHAIEAILAAATNCPEVLRDPKPTVLTWTYGDTGITYWLRFFIADFARRDILCGEVATRVWYELHRRKIATALPVRQTFLHSVTDESIAKQEEATIRDRRACIDAVDFLRGLPDESKDALARSGHRKLFAPGETIFREKDPGREFYIVRRGSVDVVVNGETIASLGQGDFFGELALLTGAPRSSSIVASVESEVFEIDDKMFSEVLRKDPKIAEQISTVVGSREASNLALHSGSGPPSMQERHGMSEKLLGQIKKLFALD